MNFKAVLDELGRSVAPKYQKLRVYVNITQFARASYVTMPQVKKEHLIGYSKNHGRLSRVVYLGQP